MILRDCADATRDEPEVMGQTPDLRLLQIITSLVNHLHAFVRESRLMEKKCREATAHSQRRSIWGNASVARLVRLARRAPPDGRERRPALASTRAYAHHGARSGQAAQTSDHVGDRGR